MIGTSLFRSVKIEFMQTCDRNTTCFVKAHLNRLFAKRSGTKCQAVVAPRKQPVQWECSLNATSIPQEKKKLGGRSMGNFDHHSGEKKNKNLLLKDF